MQDTTSASAPEVRPESTEPTTFLAAHPAADIFPLIDGAEFQELVADIKTNGVREPIWLYDGKILDGRNRYRAAQAAGVDCPTRTYDGNDPLSFVVSANLRRRNLDAGQRAAIAYDIANMRQGERTDLEPSANLQKVSMQEAAQLCNVSERSVHHFREIARADAGVASLVRTGKVNLHEGRKLIAVPDDVRTEAVETVASGGDLRTAVRAAKKSDYNARIEAAKPKPLEGTYRIFYVDPPWKYHGLNQADEYGHAEAHYDCLDDQQLIEFKPDGERLIKDLADDNAVLFLWVTAPLLRRAFPIIEAWQFTYKANFVWDKIDHVMGFYNSVRHEHLLIATKGSCTPDVKKLYDSVQPIKRTEHSRKPQEFYDIIEKLYDHGRKLELFARSGRKGWDSVGNEIGDRVERMDATFMKEAA